MDFIINLILFILVQLIKRYIGMYDPYLLNLSHLSERDNKGSPDLTIYARINYYSSRF